MTSSMMYQRRESLVEIISLWFTFFTRRWWIFRDLTMVPPFNNHNTLPIKPPSGTFCIPDTRIHYLHICSLELLNLQNEVVLEKLFDSMHFSSLEQWTLQASAFPLSMIISFIESSAFYLKAFWIFGNCDVAEKIHDLLHRLHSIEAMQVWFWFHDKPPTKVSFFELLCSTDKMAFLPHLRTLNFGYDLPHPVGISTLNIQRITPLGSEARGQYHTSISVIEDRTADRFFEFVDEEVNLSILRCGLEGR